MVMPSRNGPSDCCRNRFPFLHLRFQGVVLPPRPASLPATTTVEKRKGARRPKLHVASFCDSASTAAITAGGGGGGGASRAKDWRLLLAW
ncbi:hypothetical protein GUJ93_ZPchr0009g844 [Zizania palustris]|uniref:Uncharacterized protein n=1 Tax=Zizania palustris TaxID=103762 RepID=A0A8J5RLC2_ZIZPA|nr:hypothetical protein GUJ93_ZPchr0009g844 [Zizania palustris]